MAETLYLIDGSGFVHRAWHAIRQDLRTSRGLPTRAVLGFANMVLKLRKDLGAERVAVVFDAPGPTFREAIFPAYKANREELPEDFKVQWPYVMRLCEGFRLPVVQVEGVEADDVIATLARRARARGLKVVIVSGDKDLMQLCGDGVEMLDTLHDRRYGPAEVRERWGVPPALLGDALALIGDASDNVPGVPGVGPKTAAALIAEHGSLEGVLRAAPSLDKPKLREALTAHADTARLARRLVALRDDVELAADPDRLRAGEPDRAALAPLLRELEFTRLLDELGAGGAPVRREVYRAVTDQAALDEVIALVRERGILSIDTETTSLDAMRAELVGVALAWGEGEACYLPVGHRYLGAPAQLAAAVVIDRLKPLIEDPDLPKVGQNHKYDAVVLRRAGADLRGVWCDPMIASYLLDPARGSHGLDALAREHLGHTMIAYRDVAGSGKHQIPFSEVPVEQATAYAAEDADVALRVARLLAPRVEREGLDKLLHDVEIPLARVLAVMELHGIRLDVERLRRLSRETLARMEAIEKEVHELAGAPININSPVQLRELLFDKLALPAGRRTKSGPSTDADVLEALAPLHPIPERVLRYRELAKLRGTYMETLPGRVHPQTGRLHTSWSQAVAATGRLSSQDPNLQNIPVRTDLGREIRRAFVAEPGRLLLSADYSQIELRVLAHLSDDPILLDAFARGQDIHARTAAEIYGVDPAHVLPEQRRVAKGVVYGLSYGQTDYGLSQTLGIERGEARRIIDAFYARYRRLGEYLDSLIAEARAGRPATTLLGRRRFIPDLDSPNRAARSYAERIARNTPIQGTAADILKLAMIRVQELIETRGAATRMLLTVHDELVFEVPERELDDMRRVLPEAMSSVMALKVPLQVDVGVGPTWADAH